MTLWDLCSKTAREGHRAGDEPVLQGQMFLFSRVGRGVENTYLHEKDMAEYTTTLLLSRVRMGKSGKPQKATLRETDGPTNGWTEK